MDPFWYEAARVAGFIALIITVWGCLLIAADHLLHWLMERRRDRAE